MITFINSSKKKPYKAFKKYHDKALINKQKNIDAISISSYSNKKKEVSSRFVNLKFVDGKNFIFFSNYDSPKAKDFDTHPQVSALIYWNSINIQIRLKGKINKASKNFNSDYFKTRSREKNALSISSNQSKEISSYEEVISKYEHTYSNSQLDDCPNYWGGYTFTPYFFEFWEGHPNRLNYRLEFNKVGNT